MNYYSNGNSFITEDGLIITLPGFIQKFILLEDSVIFLIDPVTLVGDQNILCYDTLGQFKWKVAKPVKIHLDNYFTAIYFQEFALYGYSKSGIEYHINEETGEFMDSQLIK